MLERSLIVCYSYSGNTWRAAQEIRRQTGAALREIYPRQPYPMQFESVLAQVKRELGCGFLPSLLPIAMSVEEYDTIFVGAPIWCGTIAPPLTAFLQKYDLEGKRLLPFFTHCGNGKGNLEHEIRGLCPGAQVGDGIYLLEDGKSTLEQSIASWLMHF